MKDILIRALSGLFYVILLLASLYYLPTLIFLFFVFGIICLIEFNKLIQLKSIVPYFIFPILYFIFSYWPIFFKPSQGFNEALQILQVITIFVQLLLIKDLFSEKTIPLFSSKRFIITTFYLSSSFVFLISIANFNSSFNAF